MPSSRRSGRCIRPLSTIRITFKKKRRGYGYYSDGYTASVEESAEDSGAQSTIRDIRITYMLNSGLKVERWYSLYLTP